MTTHGLRLLAAAVALAVAPLAGASDSVPLEVPFRSIDFTTIDRTLGKHPTLVAEKPLYGLFLFGRNAETRVWAMLDRSKETAQAYDLLYLDRDADGDLTEDGERIVGTAQGTGTRFDIGDFRPPGSDAVHKEFTLTWTPASVRFRLLWRGAKVTMGGYGPTHDTYAPFADSPAKAPVFVPGSDRPFEFEHWMSGTLFRGRENDFKVFVGNRGSVTGAFSSVDDKFLPDGVFPIATLVCRDKSGKELRVLAKLTSRC
ncbi:MAG: hypothetical protein ACT4PV_05155 [Planctomycetaceae bacterium]